MKNSNLAMSETQVSRNHHFLADFHLRGFTPSMKKRDSLYLLDIQTGQWERKSPKEVGCLRDRYTITADGVAPDALEEMFGQRFESPAATVIRGISKSETLPSGKDLTVLVSYVALLVSRNPAVLESWADSMADLGNIMLHLYAHHEDPSVDPSRFKVKASQNAEMHFLLQRWQILYRFLMKRTWRLVITAEGAGHFVAADLPFALIWDSTVSEETAKRLQPGFGMRHTNLCVPLNHRITLMGSFAGDASTRLVDNGFVAAQNRFIICSAHRYVYSPVPEFQIMRESGEVQLISDLIAAHKLRLAG